MGVRTTDPRLNRPLLLVWGFAFLSLWSYAWPAVHGPWAAAFLLLAGLFQASLFSLPVFALTVLASRLNPVSKLRQTLLAVLFPVSFLVVGFLLANFKLYSLYGFFTNYFVLNIVSTPGGIEAMGITGSTWNSLAIAVAVVAALYALALRHLKLERLIPRSVKKRYLAVALMACFAVQSLAYAYAEYQSDLSVLGVADRIVWYIPVTAKSFFASLGIAREPALGEELRAAGGRLDYDFREQLSQPQPESGKFNVVWLVAESWRADMVTPEIMPNTYRFAQQNQWFRNHYSGGNGTRMGMFTQFYGIYGNYWFDALREQRAPLLMEYLDKNQYQEKAFTSSAFTYPEFDKTIFSLFDQQQLQEFNSGEGWQRDQKNTADLVEFIETASKPFFAFMFFESAHANYYFPPEDIIEADYLEDFNYLTVDIEAEIERVKHRYVNSVHHLDRQLARVYQALENRHLLENTIVVVTGDHGEEFMENGRWGHNSTFSQQQIRVPLILHAPGHAPQESAALTSHLDLPATMLHLLGFDQPGEEISHGQDLFSATYDRDYTVISDWHGNTLVTKTAKLVFSVKGASYHASVTDINDRPLAAEDYGDSFTAVLAGYTKELNRFYN